MMGIGEELAGWRTGIARGALDLARQSPLLRRLHHASYDRYFKAMTGNTRLFHGIYPDFPTAVAAAPRDKPIGFDNAGSSLRLADERHAVTPSDYPVMFWLSNVIDKDTTIFDFGANVGISYFAYRSRLEYPASLTWIAHDVPAVVEAGRAIARTCDAPHLQFTSDVAGISRADVMIAAGSLHFVEDPLAGLRSAARLPRHLIINKTPLLDQPSAVTLHAFGTAYCAYHLLNRTAFLAELGALGYRIVDEWRNPGLGCNVPFHPEYAIPAYSGLYLVRDGA